MSSGPPIDGGGSASVPSQYMATFEVLGELGRGGNTVTYRVRRRSTVYAMKVLHRRGPDELPERAFRREAALLASVDDPHVVRVHEVGTARGRPYLVMDYVEGNPLSDLLVDGPLPLDGLLRLGTDVAAALGAAHRAGVVHRDIKPDNILVDHERHARVIDFGLAVRPGDPAEENTAGTLLYCAPEQAGLLHRPVDGRADLYALGAVLFECATGRPPFAARDVGTLLRMHASTPAPSPAESRPDLPPALVHLIARLLAKDPDDRYQTAGGLLADLNRLTAGETDFAIGQADQARARPDRPLVGRQSELSVLRQRWARARAGAGGVALIEGEAGSGKSRLAREVVAAAQRDDALVLAAQCESDDALPLAPLRRAIDHYLDGVEALPAPQRVEARRAVRAAAGPTASLLRGLTPALDSILDAPELAADDRHQQFSTAVAGLLAGLATGAGGALLWLDDVQWLDSASRRVLRLLAAQAPEIPLLILGTSRPDSDSFAVTAGSALDLTVRLQPLPVAAVGDLVSSVTGGLAVDHAMAASLAARSNGNPFTLLQYLDAVLDAGLLRPDWGRWRLDTEGLQDLPLPVDGVDLILNRLDGLEPESSYLLGVAAVFGSVFDPVLVAQVVGTSRLRVLEVADAAAWRNLVERHGVRRYQFLHDRIREALIAQFGEDDLRRVHDRVADALEASGVRDADTVFGLARHRELGEADRDPARIYHAFVAAGRLALADQAPVEALPFLDRAAEAAVRAGIEPDFAFLESLATAEHRAGRFGQAIVTARRAHAVATGPIERARVLDLAAQALITAWRNVEASDTVAEALRELGRPLEVRDAPLLLASIRMYLAGRLARLTRIGLGTATGESREVCRLESSLYASGAWAYARQLRPLRFTLLTLRAMDPVTRIGPGPDEARLRTGLAYLDMGAGLRGPGRRNLARAATSAVAAGDPTLIGLVAWVDGFNRYTYGVDQGQALRLVLDEHARWLDVGLQSDIILMLLWDALQRGSVGVAESLADRRMALIQMIGGSGEATARFESGAPVRGAEASLRAWQDRGAEAQRLLDELLDELPDGGPQLRWEQVMVRGAALVVAYERSDLGREFDLAVAAWDALDLPVRMLIPVGWGFIITRAMGRLEQCRRSTVAERPRRVALAREAVRLASRAARTPLLRAHHRVAQAALLEVSGRPKAALRHLARHQASLRAVDAPLIAFEAARIAAHCLRALRIPGEAERQARTALSIARAENWPHRARRTAAEFGLRQPAPPPTLVTATTSQSIGSGLYRQRLDAIEQVSLAASRVLDPAKLVRIALDETLGILGGERAYLFLVEGDPPRLVPHGGRDAEGHDIADLTGYSTSTVERVRETQRPVVITGTEEGRALGAQSVVLHGLRSILAAPLLLDGRLLGIVYLDSRIAKGIFTTDDVGVLAAITSHIAVALETARAAQLEVAVATANRQRDLAETLRDTLSEMAGTLEPDLVLVKLERLVVDIVGASRAWLILGAPGDDKVAVRIDGSEPSMVEPDALLSRLLGAEEAVVGDGASRPSLLDSHERHWMAVPLRARGERLGVLLLASTSQSAYDDGRAELATAVVSQAIVAYENARLFAQVQQLATIDDLTEVANRRHFFDLAARELARARRHGRGIAAMMIDIDNFKHINDEFGHQIGDEVIHMVADRLRRFARAYDIVGRYGGEEFALLMPTGHEHPAAAAERLRATIADAPVATSTELIPVTVSVGVASLRPDDDIGTLLGRADRRLYDAKRAGRNQVCLDRGVTGR